MLKEYYQSILERKGYSDRKFISNAVNFIESKWQSKKIFFVEAPTGYGKSTIAQTISIYSLNEELKSIITFPLRALLEDQFEKFKEILSDKRILGKRYMHNADSRYLIKPITLTTIDTLSLTLFGIPPEDLGKVVRKYRDLRYGSAGHYMFSVSSIILSNVVLDEVHLLADSTKSLNFLILLIHNALENDQKLVLMSATIPKALEEKIMSYKNGFFKNSIELIRFEKGDDETFYDRDFVEERRNKDYKIWMHKIANNGEKFKRILEWIEDGKEFRKIITVFNTVKDAVDFYKIARSKNLFESIILIHSRFNEKDREKKANDLKAIKDREEYLIISTQVIEAGVDISSNLFITEIAPANSLIQRLGRFLRYEGEDRGEVHVWYEINENGDMLCHENKYKVYDRDLTQRTIKRLEELCDKVEKGMSYTTSAKTNFHLPEDYRSFLEHVYSEKDFQISEEAIENFLKILMHSDKLSIKAVEQFFNLEGSFVRSETLVPTITLDFLQKFELIKPNDSASQTFNAISEYFVPISIEYVAKLNAKEIVYLEKEEGHIRLKRESIPEYVIRNHAKLLELAFNRQSAAFVIDAKYNKEIGLEISEYT